MFKFEHLTIEGNDELGSYSELEIDDKVFPLAVILKLPIGSQSVVIFRFVRIRQTGIFCYLSI